MGLVGDYFFEGEGGRIFLCRPSFACERCGELGDHPCLEILQELLEDDEGFREAVWEAAEKTGRVQ